MAEVGKREEDAREMLVDAFAVIDFERKVTSRALRCLSQGTVQAARTRFLF